LFNKIKHCRRVATRYGKLAANDLAFVQLASVRPQLRINESLMKRKAGFADKDRGGSPGDQATVGRKLVELDPDRHPLR
jgi:hypothetical protein